MIVRHALAYTSGIAREISEINFKLFSHRLINTDMPTVFSLVLSFKIIVSLSIPSLTTRDMQTFSPLNTYVFD